MTTPVTLLAHRGASHAAPENTLAAFARALDVEGADGIEFDVRLTADGVPLVFHDADLGRMTGPEGQGRAVAATAYEAIARLSAGGEPIPTLAEVVKWLDERPATIVNVELKPVVKPELLLEACRPLLTRLAGKHTVIVSSFDPRVLMRLFGPWTRALIFEDPAGLSALAYMPLPPVDLHASAALITPETAATWTNGRSLRAWTVDDPIEAQRLVALGVTGLITNRPGPLRAELGAHLHA